MNHAEGHIGKEGFLLVLLDEAEHLIGVLFGEKSHVCLLLNSLFVSIQINVAIIARRSAIEIVKALVIGHESSFKTGLRMPRQIPLPETTCYVAFLLQHLGDGDFFGMKHRVDFLGIPGLRHPERVAPGHQGGTRGAADMLGIEVSESHPFTGDRIESRSADIGRAKATQIGISQVIDKNQHEIWGAFRSATWQCNGDDC